MNTSSTEEKPQDRRFAFLAWEPEPREPENRIPVTVFSGFLGSGKTTLLKHLLSQQPGKRIALVINDVGEVNIDASDLRQNFREGESAVEVLKELTQGCICCSIGDELADALVFLQETQNPDEIWIEASGVANPRNLLQTFCTRNFAGHGLLDVFRIQNLITVADAGMFHREWTRAAEPGGRRRHIFLNDPRHPYIELIMDQVETSDVLVLNKTDLLTPEELTEVDRVLEGLNPRAVRFGCSEGQLDVAPLLSEGRFDFEHTQQGATSDRALSQHGHEGHPHHHSHGLDTVLFQAREPVDEQAFFKVLRTGLPGVVRAKGFYWTDSHPDQCGILSLAGGILRADLAGPWFVDLLSRGVVKEEEMPEELRTIWQEPPLGDRRQEIVFIGVDLDEEDILAQVRACLKTDTLQESLS